MMLSSVKLFWRKVSDIPGFLYQRHRPLRFDELEHGIESHMEVLGENILYRDMFLRSLEKESRLLSI